MCARVAIRNTYFFLLLICTISKTEVVLKIARFIAVNVVYLFVQKYVVSVLLILISNF